MIDFLELIKINEFPIQQEVVVGESWFVITGPDGVGRRISESNMKAYMEGKTDFSMDDFYEGYINAQRKPYLFQKTGQVVTDGGSFTLSPELPLTQIVFTGPVDELRGITGTSEYFEAVNHTGRNFPIRDKYATPGAFDFGGSDYAFVNGSKIAFKKEGTYWVPTPVMTTEEKIRFDVRPAFDLDNARVMTSTAPDNKIVKSNVLDPITKQYITFRQSSTGTPDGVSLIQSGGIMFERVADRVDVSIYGAKGDGINNDYSAIIAADNYASASGKVLYFPKPSNFYLTGASLTLKTPNIIGDQATIKAANTSFHIINITGVENLKINGLSAEYQTTQPWVAQGSNPFNILLCNNFELNNCSYNNGGGFYISMCNVGYVRDCVGKNSSYMGFFLNSSHNININGCEAYTAVNTYRTEGCSSIKFIDCYAKDSLREAVRIEDSTDVVLTENEFEYCKGAVWIYAPSSSVYTRNVSIHHSVFRHCYESITKINDSYVNGPGGFLIQTMGYVDGVRQFDNESFDDGTSTLLTDLSTGVVFNSLGTTNTSVRSDDKNGYKTYEAGVNYVGYGLNSIQAIPQDWLFYINLPTPVNFTTDRVLTVDYYWGAGTTPSDPMAMSIKLYSGLDKTGFIVEIPLFNGGGAMRYQTVTAICRIPDGVDVSVVNCIEVLKNNTINTTLAFSEFRKGIENRIGYRHSTYSWHTKNVTIGQNKIGTKFPFVQKQYQYATQLDPVLSLDPIEFDTVNEPILSKDGQQGFNVTTKKLGFWQDGKWVALQANLSANTATVASGATPTKAEFDALLTELRDLKAKMRTAGLLAT